MTTDDGAQRLFVYGTLLMPAVLHAVCGRALATRPARLADFARYRLRGQVYPAIVREPGATTEGLLCAGLDEALWRGLDDWESRLYRRELVTVECADGVALRAHTYVLALPHQQQLSTAPWSPAEFERRHLAAYLARWTAAHP